MQHVEREGLRRRRRAARARPRRRRIGRSDIGADLLGVACGGMRRQHDSARRAPSARRGPRLTLARARSHRVARDPSPPQVPDEPAAVQLPDARRRGAAAPLHRRRRAARDRRAGHRARRGRPGLRPVRARLHRRRSPASGAAASASATPSSSRRRACRWRSCPTTTSSPARSHEPAVELAEKIKELAPGRMARVFYQSSGSEANDTQVKFAWYYNNALGRPAKKKIISRVKGYHGVTIVAASLTGLPNNHRDFDLPVDGHPPHRHPALLEGRRARRERARLLRPPRRRARGADRGRGPRHRRRLHRRAGDGRGRRHRPARGLLRGDRRGLRAGTTC